MSDQPAEPSDSTLSLADVTFRESFGLPAGAAFIAAVHALDPSEVRYSYSEVPLLPDEAERVDRQIGIQNAMLGRDVWLASTFPGTFAGLAIDHTRGCVIELYMTSPADATAAVAQLEAVLVAHAPEFEVHQVEFSHAEMQAAHQAIGERMTDLRAVGIPISSVGIGTRRNRVHVTARHDPAAVRAALESMVGADMLAPVEIFDLEVRVITS